MPNIGAGILKLLTISKNKDNKPKDNKPRRDDCNENIRQQFMTQLFRRDDVIYVVSRM